MSYKKYRLSNGPCGYSEAEEKSEIIDEKIGPEDIICNSDVLNPQYVNIECAQSASAEKSKVFTKIIQLAVMKYSFIHIVQHETYVDRWDEK